MSTGLLFNIMLEVLVRPMRQENEKKKKIKIERKMSNYPY